MIAAGNLETVVELASEAGRLADHARTKLGIGGDVSSTRATTAEMAEALAAFHFPDDLWARVIYDLVLTARARPADVERFVAALVPIYFGRVGSFVIENRSITTEQAEDRVERQAREFELLKPYLVERWTGSRRRRQGGGTRQPLAASRAILIPVANPLTAEELIKLGSAILDKKRRADRARDRRGARGDAAVRRDAGAARSSAPAAVLDFAPEGTTISPSCASAGGRPRASSRRPASRSRTS